MGSVAVKRNVSFLAAAVALAFAFWAFLVAWLLFVPFLSY